MGGKRRGWRRDVVGQWLRSLVLDPTRRRWPPNYDAIEALRKLLNPPRKRKRRPAKRRRPWYPGRRHARSDAFADRHLALQRAQWFDPPRWIGKPRRRLARGTPPAEGEPWWAPDE